MRLDPLLVSTRHGQNTSLHPARKEVYSSLLLAGCIYPSKERGQTDDVSRTRSGQEL